MSERAMPSVGSVVEYRIRWGSMEALPGGGFGPPRDHSKWVLARVVRLSEEYEDAFEIEVYEDNDMYEIAISRTSPDWRQEPTP